MVVLCDDPVTNLMAETACIASVDLGIPLVPLLPGKRPVQAVTLKGIEPCFLRTIVRDSTKSSFGLALVAKKREKIIDNNKNEKDRKIGKITTNNNAETTAIELRERVRLASYRACEQASEGWLKKLFINDYWNSITINNQFFKRGARYMC